jgi:hypothetical protein
MSADLRASLERRVSGQIECEVRGDVRALYEFTLPTIRARRVAQRNDEPDLTLSEIQEFVDQIDSANVLSIEVESFHPSVDRFANSPAAVVVTNVMYNQRGEADRFRCLWVYSNGQWYSTATNKRAWSCGSNNTDLR